MATLFFLHRGSALAVNSEIQTRTKHLETGKSIRKKKRGHSINDFSLTSETFLY